MGYRKHVVSHRLLVCIIQQRDSDDKFLYLPVVGNDLRFDIKPSDARIEQVLADALGYGMLVWHTACGTVEGGVPEEDALVTPTRKPLCDVGRLLADKR